MLSEGRTGLIKSIPFYVEGRRLWGTLHHPAHTRSPCIVGLHGLEGEKDRGKWPIFAGRFCEARYAFFRFNFQGCGTGREKSEGQFEDTSLTGRIRDYEAALRVLGEQRAVDGERMGVVGSSFGGMVAVAAQNSKVRAMVTLAVPLTLFRSGEPPPSREDGWITLPSGRRLKDGFVKDLRRHDLLNAVTTAPPLLILHGSNDVVAPVEDAYALYDAAADPKHLEILAGSDHAFTRDLDLEKVIDLSLGWFQRYL
jgi:dipeptidyl aminopeptidase/acylaminoacyl peptidase